MLKRLLIFLSLFLLNISFAFAQSSESSSYSTSQKGTVLPETRVNSVIDCQIIMNAVEQNTSDVIENIFKKRANMTLQDLNIDKAFMYEGDLNSSDILGCAIKTGAVSFWMLPYFIRYILELILGLMGLLSVAGVVVGGYMYLFSGFSEDAKSKGKSALVYSVVGFVIALLSYAIVNIVIMLVTL